MPYVPDSVGAYLVHGLLIANNHVAVDLTLEIMEARPELLPQCHGAGPFVGENCLHVLAANRRQTDVPPQGLDPWPNSLAPL